MRRRVAFLLRVIADELDPCESVIVLAVDAQAYQAAVSHALVRELDRIAQLN